MPPSDFSSLVKAFRDAVRQGDHKNEEKNLRAMIGQLPLEASFELAREQLSDFLPTFEAEAQGGLWARQFLDSASAWFVGGEPAVQPIDFEQEEERYSFAGARNYISGLEELWLAIQKRANHKEFERWIFEAISNGFTARLECFWGELHEGAPELRSPGLSPSEELKKATEVYIAKQKDGRFQERRMQLLLKLAGRFEQLGELSRVPSPRS